MENLQKVKPLIMELQLKAKQKMKILLWQYERKTI